MYQILDALKDVLKERRLTYGQLALRLEVSLPTVKRWMNGQGTSLEDLLRIMDSVGLDLSELGDRAAHQRGEETFFTAEQEEVLAANPEALVLLFALREDQTPEEFERRHGLSRKATLRLLRLLENMDLIETRGIQVVRVRARGAIRWDDRGKIGQTFTRALLNSYAERGAQPPADSKLHMSFCGRNLTDKDYAELVHDLRTIDEKFRRRSYYNTRALKRDAFKRVSYCVIADEWDPAPFQAVRPGLRVELGDRKK